jgi:hypothetical protein
MKYSTNNDDHFHTTRSLSQSDVNLTQKKCIEDSCSLVIMGVNDKTLIYLERSQCSLSTNAIDQSNNIPNIFDFIIMIELLNDKMHQ